MKATEKRELHFGLVRTACWKWEWSVGYELNRDILKTFELQLDQFRNIFFKLWDFLVLRFRIFFQAMDCCSRLFFCFVLGLILAGEKRLANCSADCYEVTMCSSIQYIWKLCWVCWRNPLLRHSRGTENERVINGWFVSESWHLRMEAMLDGIFTNNLVRRTSNE